MLTLLADNEKIFLEPSATAGLLGPLEVLQSDYIKKHNIDPTNITHVAWATGGGLVPEEEMNEFYRRGANNGN